MTPGLPRTVARLPIPALMAFALLLMALPTQASVALLMEEPYGEFGAFNPTGHTAVYLNHVCADTPTRLRPCLPGEQGAVISRYHHIHGDDWIVMPIVPYLYAVDQLSEVPTSVDRAQLVQIRDAYWKAHLQTLAPANPDGSVPGGEWYQLVGASYIRRIYGFEVNTTPEQDQRLIAEFNDQRNISHFNLFFHNCADFSKAVLDVYFPHTIHRNWIADLGMTTPKQVARSLVKYSRKHPELHMSVFVIPQVPGTVQRSHHIDGVAESVVKSKKYILPLVILQPEFAGALVVGYLTEGRLSVPKHATVFHIGDSADDQAQALDRTQPITPPPPPPPSPPAS